MRRLRAFLIVIAATIAACGTASAAAVPAPGLAPTGPGAPAYALVPLTAEGGGHAMSGGSGSGRYNLYATSVGAAMTAQAIATPPRGGGLAALYSTDIGYVAQLRSVTFAAGPNQPPTLDPIADRTILEDSGSTMVPLSGISDGGDVPAQNLTITAVSSDLTVMLNPTVLYSPGSASGQLLMAPLPNANGSVTITVRAQDDGTPNAFIVRTFQVAITAVNDPPLIDIPPDLVINENASQQTVPLSGIAAGGGADENSQVLTVTALSSNTTIIPTPTVFYGNPSATGTLVFTPTHNAYGSVTILLRVADTGGTANGGLNVTFRSFNVTVTHISIPPVLTTSAPNVTMPEGTTAVISRSNLSTTDDLPASQITYTLKSAPVDGGSSPRGVLRARGVAVPVNGTFTQADVDAGLVSFADGGTGAATITLGLDAQDGETPPNDWTDGTSTQLHTQTFTVNVTAGAVANTAPQITLPSADPTWTEGDPPVLIDSGATVIDAENNLGSGRILAQLTNGTGSDVIGVRNAGAGSGQIGVSGSTVTYGGTPLGFINATNNGVGAAPLQIDLAGGAIADQAAVQALLQALTFRNLSTNPSTAVRNVQVTVTDGPGLTSNLAAKNINVVGINSAPFVAWSKPGTTYVEGASPLVIDNAATVFDSDSATFDGGLMTLSFAAAGTAADQLSIWNEGINPGQIGIAGSNVVYGGAPIGSFSGGANGSPLQIVFAAGTTPTQAQALLEHIQFQNTSHNPSTAPRIVQVVVSDGPGSDPNAATSAPALISIAVQSIDDAPIVTLPGADPIDWTKGGTPDPLPLDLTATVTDVDSANFAGGTLVVDFASGAQAGDLVTILPEGSGAGQIDVVGGTVRYGGAAIGTVAGMATANGPMLIQFTTAAATPAAAQELVRCLAFSNNTANPVDSPPNRVVRAVVLDGGGATSAAVTKTVRVHNSDLKPIVTIAAGPVAFTEAAGPVRLDPGQAATVTDADSADFVSGNLIITCTDGSFAEDTIAVRSVGTGAGQIGIAAAPSGAAYRWAVQYGGNVIGTIAAGTDGTAGTPLVVAFTSTFATPAATQALLRSIQYDNSSRDPLWNRPAGRDLQIVVNDGDGMSSDARHVAIAITAIDDPPVPTPSLTLGTIAGIAVTFDMADPTVQPFATDVDSHSALVFAITPGATAHGTIASAGANRVLYTPAAGFAGDDTFAFRVSDATTLNVPATATVHVTRRLDEARPHLITDGPREAFNGDPFVYAVRIDGSQLVGSIDGVFRLTGAIPTGMVITRTGAASATVTWSAATATATGGAGAGAVNTHYEFGVLYTDSASHTSAWQPLEFLLRAPPSGGG